MRYDRDWFLRAVRVRLDRAGTADGGVAADVVYGPDADAELRGLLRTCDTRTDMEARHAAGWLCVARAMADPGPRGSVHGCMAGTLLFPVWVAEPSLVPAELAAGYASHDPAVHPDPVNADGPHEWMAQVAAFGIAWEGRQHTPPPDASEADRWLHEVAAVLTAMIPSRDTGLATALGLGRLVLLTTPEYDPWLAGRLRGVAEFVNLAGAAWPFEDLADADPVRFVRGALRRIPPGSPERVLVLDGLGRRLLARYLETHDPEDLHEAVGIARDVLAQLPSGHPHLPSAFGALGEALVLLRQAAGATPEECDEVVDVCRRALTDQVKGPAGAGHNLGMALVLRAHHTGRVADLDEAITVFTEALAAARQEGETAALRNALSNARRARSVATGSQDDLDEALDLADPSDRPQLPLIGPAVALYNRYLRDPKANSADLDEALRRLRHAEKLMPPTHPDRPAALDDLGLVLTACYQRSGNPEELNESVLVHRESVALTVEGHGSLGIRLLNLGTALTLRNQLTEDGDDLREAQECRRRATGLPGMGPAHRAALLSSTGLSLMPGVERAPDPVALLDEAVRLLREALALTPESDPRLPRRRHNLAVALLLRISRTMRIDQAREARELADAVVAALPPNSPDLPGALTVAGGARLLSLRTLVSSSARKEAVALYRRAVEATPPGHPTRTQRLSNLGNVLRGPGSRRRRRRADLVEAAERFQEAALEQQCAPVLRLDAARDWGDTRAELGDWAGALEGYVVAVDLLHAVAPRHLARDDQEFLLGRSVGLGAAAAACAVRCGRPGLAVGLLEQARGVILSHAFDADSDLTRLRDTAPALADRFEHLRDSLDTATVTQEFLPEQPTPPLPPTTTATGTPTPHTELPTGPTNAHIELLTDPPTAHTDAPTDPTDTGPDAPTGLTEAHAGVPYPPPPAHAEVPYPATGIPTTLATIPATAPAIPRADERQRLAAEWRELTARIRAEHPESGLLRPVRDWDEGELRAAAAVGPVVLVNVSPYGSDALIVTERAVDAVPLPDLDPRRAATRERALDEAVDRLRSPGISHKQSLEAQQVVRETLDWLWRTVTGPVLGHLRIPSAPEGPWPRLWWSPAGVLRTLPFHAAAPADGTPGALDRVVSSYTPTLRALHHARERLTRPSQHPTSPGALIVSVPQAPGHEPLPGTRREAEYLTGLLPGSTLLADAHATRAAVLSALPRHAYAHFACHALGDPERPSAGGPVLHDHAEHPLTVRDLSRHRLPAVQLAYLSACDTLRTSPELADEAVHIVSAFQMAGFPHVVGSLWHVDDTIAAEAVPSVYTGLRTATGTLDVTRTAHALHTTVRTLRTRYPTTPSLWACQVHAGP
ncbi:CHAT domain-containing protein [Streptomyces sp. S.PB5]|uniref:CHAT domain-containing protein n=1 Tax=Streptomyces sp. S.PB5 TaxID=3020844 RepID=UPI0025AEF950|nr:CHAT domain-containing protein [Streptomyces sp. S.PB5]MDN3020539.1 CHAT domain-containing protein [Streptomyces sp. S.PB5]